SYFPRSNTSADPAETTGSLAETSAEASAPTTGLALVGAPLPPRRPAELSAGASVPARQARASAPLDLSQFTIRSGP
ncbi:hypothetical protein, partial [Klebsiella pneumoniae]